MLICSSWDRFCFGGAQAVRLGSTGLFNSAVIAHPGNFSNSDLEAMNVGFFFFSPSHCQIQWHHRYLYHGSVLKVRLPIITDSQALLF